MTVSPTDPNATDRAVVSMGVPSAAATSNRSDDDAVELGLGRLMADGFLAGDAFGEDRSRELAAVRTVAAAGPGLALGRLFDGHRNAVERVLRHRPQDVPEMERRRSASGELRLGVWGAEPGPADGPSAVLESGDDGFVLRGVKTFCSGAGLLDRAIVLVRRSADGPPTLPVLVDLTAEGTVRVDRSWFVGDALRASRSDRVVFAGAPVVAVLGEEGTLSAAPWFAGDALRSTAVWAGAADAVVDALIRNARLRPPGEADLERLGRADAIRAGVDAWLEAGLAAVSAEHAGGPAAAPTVDVMRLELTERLRSLLRIAGELSGSRGLVADRAFAAARADLDVLLLQHRLAPLAARRGRAVLDGERT